jgi:hypothetical protein
VQSLLLSIEPPGLIAGPGLSETDTLLLAHLRLPMYVGSGHPFLPLWVVQYFGMATLSRAIPFLLQEPLVRVAGRAQPAARSTSILAKPRKV